MYENNIKMQQEKIEEFYSDIELQRMIDYVNEAGIKGAFGKCPAFTGLCDCCNGCLSGNHRGHPLDESRKT